MLGTGHYGFALLGAMLAIAPPTDVHESVDRQTTTAIVNRPGEMLLPRPASLGDISPLKTGLDALSAREIARALSLRDALPQDSLDRHILSWAIALRGGALVPSAEISATARALSDWPATDALRRNAERALLRENPAPAQVVATFQGKAPQTMEGIIILTRAQVALGNPETARAVLLPFWRTAKLSPQEEAAILKEFGALVSAADHRFRMERMLHADRVASALSIAKLAGAEALAAAWSAVIKNDGNAGKLLDAVPAEQRSAGYFFARAKYLRKGNNIEEAAAVMLQAPTNRGALADADAWWIERRALSRELMDRGDVQTAYRIAAEHSAETASNAVDAEFHAGWYALRGLDDAAKAAEHFSRIAILAEGAISRARAYYWLGRAAEAGGPGDAKAYFERAAEFGTTFYGQLAAERIGRSTVEVGSPMPTEADRRDFDQREAVQAIKRLEEAGYASLADTLCQDLAAQLTSPGELALLALTAEQRDNHFLALKVGKIAASRGIEIGALSHPIGAIPATADVSGAGEALAYAIARQESEFKVSAVSGAGARGLLQLLPATAKEAAKKAGLPFSATRLTTDAGYNASLGATFLGEQLSRFDGSYVLTFAGYNAGPRRAREWINRYGDPRGKDVDTVVDWIERIPFSETRSYVQRVMENFQVYKMRFSGNFDIVGDLTTGR